jgi:hypothetical protein
MREGSENGVFRCGWMMVSFTFEEDVLIREEDSHDARGMLMPLVQLPAVERDSPARGAVQSGGPGRTQIDGPRRQSGLGGRSGVVTVSLGLVDSMMGSFGFWGAARYDALSAKAHNNKHLKPSGAFKTKQPTILDSTTARHKPTRSIITSEARSCSVT